MTDDSLRHVADRQDITTLLHRYARGIDRCDEAALLSIWTGDARADYGSGWEDARNWCRGVLERLRPMTATMHALSNIIINIDGDRAAAETYCQAYHLLPDRQRMIVGGRYLDLLERTSDGWKISRRRYVMDWNETEPSTAQFPTGQFATGQFARFTTIGGRYPDDPLYRTD